MAFVDKSALVMSLCLNQTHTHVVPANSPDETSSVMKGRSTEISVHLVDTPMELYESVRACMHKSKAALWWAVTFCFPPFPHGLGDHYFSPPIPHHLSSPLPLCVLTRGGVMNDNLTTYAAEVS